MGRKIEMELKEQGHKIVAKNEGVLENRGLGKWDWAEEERREAVKTEGHEARKVDRLEGEGRRKEAPKDIDEWQNL